MTIPAPMSQATTLLIGVFSGHSPPRNAIAPITAIVTNDVNIFFITQRFHKNPPDLAAGRGLCVCEQCTMVTICVLEPPVLPEVGRRRRSQTFIARAKSCVLPLYYPSIGRTLSPPRAFPQSHKEAGSPAPAGVLNGAISFTRRTPLQRTRGSQDTISWASDLPIPNETRGPAIRLIGDLPSTARPASPAPYPRNPFGTPEDIPAIRGLVSVKEQLSILHPGVAPGLRPCRSI